MGRVLGLDFGRKRVGAALSDPGRSIATPLEVYAQRDPVQNARHYRGLVEEHDVDLLVVGLPLHTSGRMSELAEAARSWGDWLSNTTGRPVAYFDERYTSVEAERVLLDAGFTSQKRKNLRDMLAAQMTLQAFLDAGCPTTTAAPQPLGDSTPDA
jgi:putative Holliday junction resolvase